MSNTTISKGGLSATISSKGAELTSLALDGREYLWQADPTFWGKHAPVLFPIVGSLRGDEAESAQGTCRMPRHGLARINEHRVAGVAEDGSAVTFEFTSSPETLEAYPYEFKLNMTYAITGEVDDPAVLWTLKNSVAKGEKYEGILTVGEKGTAVLNKADDSLIEIATEAPKEK